VKNLLILRLMRAGRLEYVLRFPIPDEEDRLEYLKSMRRQALGHDVDLRELAQLTEGMVGSQIASICRSAAMIAIAETIRGKRKRYRVKLLIGFGPL